MKVKFRTSLTPLHLSPFPSIRGNFTAFTLYILETRRNFPIKISFRLSQVLFQVGFTVLTSSEGLI